MRNINEDLKVLGEENRNNRSVQVGEFLFVDTNKVYKTLGGLRNAIRNQYSSSKEYYDKWYKLDTEGTCEVCSSSTRFVSVIQGYANTCSVSCGNKTTHKKELFRKQYYETNKLEAGKLKWLETATTEEKELATQKRLKTLEETHPGQLVKNLEKGRKTVIEKKQDKTYLDNWTKKMLDTKVKNNSFGNGMTGKVKDLEYSNRTFKFQGYEDLLIKYLTDTNVEFVNHDKVPKVRREDVISKAYRADFYLPKYDLFIDVKSERTFSMGINDGSLLKKQQSVFDSKHNFLVFAIKTVTKDRTLCETDKKEFMEFLDKTISSQALNEGRFNDYPVIGSTLQAIGSGSAKGPLGS
jgi:hypothetical protein